MFRIREEHENYQGTIPSPKKHIILRRGGVWPGTCILQLAECGQYWKQFPEYPVSGNLISDNGHFTVISNWFVAEVNNEKNLLKSTLTGSTVQGK